MIFLIMQKPLRILSQLNIKRLLSTIDDHGHDMSTKLFWKRFYEKHNSKPFEWLIEYDRGLLSLDEKQLKGKLALEPGCGTSVFSSKLLDGQNSFLICADFSRDALKQLQASATLRSQLVTDFVLCDCTNLPFRDNLFDIIIDKGYLDSILKSKDMKLSLRSLINMIDKLKHGDGNLLMQITDETPELRIDLFDRIAISNLNHNYKEIKLSEQAQQSYFIYFLSKH